MPGSRKRRAERSGPLRQVDPFPVSRIPLVGGAEERRVGAAVGVAAQPIVKSLPSPIRRTTVG